MSLNRYWQAYRALLKPLPLEGIPDLIIFRPPAFLLVQGLRRLPVTPNQVSFSALLTGFIAAFSFALGTPQSFRFAALFYAFTVVLDCADGMLARLKKLHSPFGRMVDGFIDYANGSAILLGFAVGLSKGDFDLPADPWLLTALGGLSMAVHCFVVDHYRSEFAVHALGKRTNILDEIREQESRLRKLGEQGVSPAARFLARLSLAYHKAQARVLPAGRRYEAREYYHRHKYTLRAWTMIELTMHILALILSALLYEPMIFFVYSIVAANVWMVLLTPIQFLVNRRIRIQPAVE